MKKILAILLVCVCLSTMLAACGGGGGNPNAGTYTGVYGKWVGDETQEDITANKLELKGDGTGTHYRDDLELKITWTVEGEKFSMTEKFLGVTMDYTGTIKNGEIHVFNGDPEDMLTYEYVYKK